MDRNRKRVLVLLITTLGIISACQAGPVVSSQVDPVPSPSMTVTATLEPRSTPTIESAVTPTNTAAPTETPSYTSTPFEPAGCLEPPNDYTLVHVSGFLLNRRTAAMLEHAAELYDGEIDLLGSAITQGSYTDSVSASFGTHSGGGAVDLSVMRAGTYTVLYDEIEPLIQSLRTAGFAAWLRDFDEVEPGSPIHIHAIAIGDEHLSPAARDQLTGEYGYFRGFNGLPQDSRPPQPDRHGGPVICNWMLSAGYADLRPTVTPMRTTSKE